MNMDNRRSITQIIFGASLIVLLCLVVFVGSKFVRSKGPVTIDSGFRPVMGTFAHIVAVAADSNTAQKSVEAAFSQLVLIDNLMSDYKPDSQLSKVNREAFKNPVKIDEPLFEVLSRSIVFSRKTGGAFDVTVGPLVDLYHAAGDKDSLPSEDEIAQAKARTGFEKLLLDAKTRTVKFAVEGMRLDFGAIAKGYAVDKAVEAMQKCGALGGLVAASGDIRVFGTPPKGKNFWIIGLQDPNKVITDSLDMSQPLLVLHINDAAVSTSGDYRRFAQIKGKKYSHIIDPRTGTSSRTLSSVTIIAPNATDADALATAVSVMGARKGLELIKTIPDTEAILISVAPEFKIMQTEGAKKYIYK